jgi:uncharacterized protein with ParB-like and HNH nuclease domain/predicted transport protein
MSVPESRLILAKTQLLGGGILKANATKLLGFLHKASQFVIPIYQRNYSWDEKQCQQLWEDILRVGSNSDIGVHFIGSIVYVEGGQSQVTLQAPLLVIDGQQRLTTISLILEALARAVGDSEPVEGFSAEKIRHNYLTNSLEKDERFYKLVLSDTDKDTLKALIKGNDYPLAASIKIRENFDYFAEQIKLNGKHIDEICNGLAKLMIVDISLERNQDNPQLIFESMNSTGKALSQADLIRNFILMGLEPELQNSLYAQYWRPMELEFGQEAYGDEFDAFMRHYLTIKTGDVPRVSEVYEAFKEYSTKFDKEDGVTDLVAEIRKYSKYFVAMALGGETNPALKPLFKDLIQDLNYSVAYPLLLELYADYDAGTLNEKDFGTAIKLVESYVFRRSICEIPTNSMNKTFAEFSRYLVKNDYLNSIYAHFYSLPSYRRFPSNEEFRLAFETKDLYNIYSRAYWLRKMENFGKKELVAVENYTIEHILPQNPNLSAEWKNDLGNNWEEIQAKYLHTLGNLTLTGYNSEYSDKPFKEKKSMKGGFLQSPLTLNEKVREAEVWNESAILERAAFLSKRAIEIWPRFEVDAGTLKKFEAVKSAASNYTLADHPNLERQEVRALFDALRAEVLALDSNISETVLKYYIAFKAETNFVDVIPKARWLRLSLNLKFSEIDDPRGIATDVTGKGRWGNGDVSINFKKIDELPYVTGLIKQSLSKQLSNG